MKNYNLFNYYFTSLLAILFIFFINPLLSQRVISGTVSDENGAGLTFANVQVKGTSTGTITDDNGFYQITFLDEPVVLVFSFVGYNTQEIEVGSSDVINVTLSQGVSLEDVIVTAIGLEANKRQLGYALQNVDVDEILSSGEENLVDALNAKVAGVSVITTSGSPGASSRIRIRGSNSITGSSSPLFVLDGIPIDNTSYENDGGIDWSNRVIDINPHDIESITVLKGASASALYGVRAANGAIIITTKTGHSGNPVVNITTSFGIDQVNKVPERQNLYAQGSPVNGVPVWRGPDVFESFSYGPLISTLEYDGSEYDFDRNGRLVPVGSGNGIPATAYDPYSAFITGTTYDLNASVQGGNEWIDYYLSGGIYSNSGTVPNSSWSRQSFRVNVNSKISEKLSAGMSANFINSGGYRVRRGNDVRAIMVGILRTAPTFDNGNGKTGQDAAEDREAYIRLSDDGQRSYNAGIYDNPYWTVNKNSAEDDVNRLIGYLSLNYSFSPSLSLQYKLGIDQYSDRGLSVVDINPGLRDGFIIPYHDNQKDLNSDLLLKFKQELSDNWIVNVIGGYNYFDSRKYSGLVSGNNLSVPDFYHINNAGNVNAFENIFQKRIHAAFGMFDINYNDFLFLNVTARNDWSSSLPKNNNQFQSYSASLGFAFTEALNLLNNEFLSYGKFRLSYGVVGKDAPIYSTSNYFQRAVSGSSGFENGIVFPALGTNAFERSTILGNDLLRPEKTTTWEIGGEIQFFRGRTGIDITYFDSKTEDLILNVEIPSSTGYKEIVQNAGIITNKGWEAIIHGSPLRDFVLDWDVSINFTHLDNRVIQLSEGTEFITLNFGSSAIPGEPYGVLFGRGWLRDENGKIMIGSHGFPLEDPEGVKLGDPNPDFTMGIRNTFRYKGISLSALLDIRKGGDVHCGTCTAINYFGTSQLTADQRNEIVVFDGVLQDGTSNNIAVKLADPELGIASYYWVRYGFPGIDETTIFDGSWIRLRELTLDYNLPQSILKKNLIKAATISVTGRNLWLKTNFPGIDPETNLTGNSNGFGYEYFGTPNTKSYSVSLKLTF